MGRIKETVSVCTKTLQLVWDSEKLLFLGNLAAVLIPAVFPFITAYIFKLMIDLVFAAISKGTVDYQRIYLLTGALLLTNYLQRMSFTIQDYFTKILFTKFPITVYQLVLDRVSSLDLRYFEDSSFHDSLQKVRENYNWRPVQLVYNLFFLLQSLTQVLIALFMVLRLNIFLAVLIMAVSVPDLINQILFSRFSWNVWSQNTPYRKRFLYLASLLQNRDGIKELKIFQTRPRFLREILETQLKFFRENKQIAIRQFRVNTAFNILDTFVIAGIAIYVILEAVRKRLTIGDITFYQSVLSNFNSGIGGLFRNLEAVFDHSLYVKSVFDVLDIESGIKQQPGAIRVDFNKTPRIEFKNVTFAYPGTKQRVLKNFSLTINPGEKVAFVGENGAGKTTIVKLLARFYDVDSGEILIDGINIKELNLESWYRALGVLFQDFIKYEYPVKDNIFFGRVWEKENLEKIIEASKAAGSDQMVRRFEHEYDQMLGRTFEGGLELSGGQWQKIALARAFFRNAPVLILDEPTASIDAKAESEIFNRVEKLSRNKTVLIISHRFSTVRNADKIYVIENGSIIESGSHRSLMELNGQYATLFKLQAKGYR